jgi:hypothetical protein
MDAPDGITARQIPRGPSACHESRSQLVGPEDRAGSVSMSTKRDWTGASRRGHGHRVVARLARTMVGLLAIACAPREVRRVQEPARVVEDAAPPESVDTSRASEPDASAQATAALPRPAELPRRVGLRQLGGPLADGAYEVDAYYLGPRACPPGRPNAGLCGPRWVLGPQARAPNAAARRDEVVVLGQWDPTGAPVDPGEGETGIDDLEAGKRYLLVVVVREISGERFIILRGGRAPE